MSACKECKFYKVDPSNVSKGFCHKNTPTLTVVITPRGPAPIGGWPPVDGDEWCGEYQVRVQ